MSALDESEQMVKSWGFQTVFTWMDRPGAHHGPHTHAGETTHFICRGNLTISYPEDGGGQKRTYGPGERLDVAAGRLHEVWIGEKGCEYVIGQ